MIKTKTTSKVQSWNLNLRNKVGDSVTHNGITYVNISGRNSEPPNSGDWKPLNDEPFYEIEIVSGTNNLILYKDSSPISTVDLTLYLDDTNLARLTTGEVDSNTAIATFTRDDGTTFTVDFSSLLGGSGGAKVQSDWSQSTNTEDDFIKNKPNILTKDEIVGFNDPNEYVLFLNDKRDRCSVFVEFKDNSVVAFDIPEISDLAIGKQIFYDGNDLFLIHSYSTDNTVACKLSVLRDFKVNEELKEIFYSSSTTIDLIDGSIRINCLIGAAFNDDYLVLSSFKSQTGSKDEFKLGIVNKNSLEVRAVTVNGGLANAGQVSVYRNEFYVVNNGSGLSAYTFAGAPLQIVKINPETLEFDIIVQLSSSNDNNASRALFQFYKDKIYVADTRRGAETHIRFREFSLAGKLLRTIQTIPQPNNSSDVVHLGIVNGVALISDLGKNLYWVNVDTMSLIITTTYDGAASFNCFDYGITKDDTIMLGHTSGYVEYDVDRSIVKDVTGVGNNSGLSFWRDLKKLETSKQENIPTLKWLKIETNTNINAATSYTALPLTGTITDYDVVPGKGNIKGSIIELDKLGSNSVFNTLLDLSGSDYSVLIRLYQDKSNLATYDEIELGGRDYTNAISRYEAISFGVKSNSGSAVDVNYKGLFVKINEI